MHSNLQEEIQLMEIPWMKAEFRIWCGRGDSNPHALRRHPLKMVRLPVPPLPPGVIF